MDGRIFHDLGSLTEEADESGSLMYETEDGITKKSAYHPSWRCNIASEPSDEFSDFTSGSLGPREM